MCHRQKPNTDKIKNDHHEVPLRNHDLGVDPARAVVAALTTISPPAANDSVAALVSERASRILRRLGR